MSGRGLDTGDIDELLKRVRSLQKLLPSPRNDDDDQIRVPNVPQNNYRPQPSNTAYTTQHNGVNRSERARDNTANIENVPVDPQVHPTLGSRENYADQLAEESLDLLKQVTFIRIVVDRLNWHKIPEFFKKEFAGHKSPRDRGQVIVEYQLPSVESSYQTLKKRVKVFAKNVVPSVAHFNHRRVALLQMNASLLQLWTKASIWFRLMVQLPGTGQVRQIGRAHLPLEQVLLVPFSVETDLRLDVLQNEVGPATATLKVSVQLGSRHSAFTDRVEQLRSNILGESPRDSRYHLMDPVRIVNKFGVDPPPAPTAHENACTTASAARNPRNTQIKDHNLLHPLRPEQTHDNPPSIRINERMNCVDRRESCGVLLSGGNARTRGNNAVEVGVQSHEWKSTSSQTDSNLGNPSRNRRKPSKGQVIRDNERNVSIQTSDHDIVSLEANSTLESQTGHRGRTRTETVADRLRKTRSSEEGIQHRGQSFEITVHCARDLPYVKGANGEAVKPSVYVSYRGESAQMTSPIVAKSTRPTWNWTTTFDSKPDRKTIVLKVWHSCAARGARVLGFVCLDLSAIGAKAVAGDYDLVDLSQSSTGTIRVTMRMLDSYTDFLEESMFPVPQQRSNEDVGVNTSFLPPPPPPIPRRSSPVDPYLELASRSFLADKLKINMNELDSMVNGLRTTGHATYRNS